VIAFHVAAPPRRRPHRARSGARVHPAVAGHDLVYQAGQVHCRFSVALGVDLGAQHDSTGGARA